MENVGSLNKQLYEKMLAEQKAYREQLLSMTPDEMLDASYEYNLRGDILALMGVHSLPDEQAKALLQSSSPISDVLRVYKDMETHHMDEVLKAMEKRAAEAVKAFASKKHDTMLKHKEREPER